MLQHTVYGISAQCTWRATIFCRWLVNDRPIFCRSIERICQVIFRYG